MTWFLDNVTAEPPAPETTAPPQPSWGEQFGAAWRRMQIEDDAWQRKQGIEYDLLDEIVGSMPDDLRVRMSRPYSAGEYRRNRLAELFEVLPEWQSTDPEGFSALETEGGAKLPASREEFDQLVADRRRAEWEEAQSVLEAGDSLSANLLGSMAGGLWNPETLSTLPLGAPASVRLGATIAIEAGAAAFAETGLTERRSEVARELGLDQPNPVADIALAAAGGGVFGGAIKVLPRALRGAARIAGYDRAKAVARLADEAEAAAPPVVRNDEVTALADRLAVGEPAPSATATGAPPTMADFDFSAGGNASPTGNRIGYVYGKLLEKGYEPHVAAGLVGNLMQESGAALDTRAVGDGGNAIGIGQWNGPRMRALQAFAQERGKPWHDLDTQIDFLDYELRGPEAAAGDAIRAARTADEAAAIGSKRFWRPGIPHIENRVRYAAMLDSQFQGGEIPRWTGNVPDVADIPTGTSRGYTGRGQVTAGDEFRIDVEYQVVDAAALRMASGDLQPRDRSRGTSDAWIADTAARLDPQLLLRSPTADRGAPIVGPDNVIESGNGRFAAIGRAYDRFPDRASAYRQAIEEAGFEIPQGVEQPVLVARRLTEMDDATRSRFAVAAQDSGVARMSPTEAARANARAMTAERLGSLNPGRALGDAENSGFTRSILDALPRSERNAMFDADGALNAEGLRRMSQAMFARAWDAPDILARYAEAEDAGELRGLMTALESAAPEWAVLRAEIEAGRVSPAFDITGHVLEAMRLIARARDDAAKTGNPMAGLVQDFLDDVDLVEGALSPLSAALVKTFWRNGRAASAETVAGFLTRYAREAREAGKAGDMFGATAAEVLRRVGGEAMADLPDDFGLPRATSFRGEVPIAEAPPGEMFDDGAASPEVEAAMSAGPPRNDRVTRVTGPEGRAALRELRRSQGIRDLDDLMARADRNHSELQDAIGAAARAAGAGQKTAKAKARARVEEKIAVEYGGRLHRVTDAARGGVSVETPEAADVFIDALSKRFRVLDKGWNVLADGYIDRKLLVVFDDGQLGEVQIWPPGLLEAKDATGHKLYELSRDLTQPEEARAAATREMRELYADVRAKLPEGWQTALGDQAAASGGKAAPNSATRSANASREISGEPSSARTARGPIDTQELSSSSMSMVPGSSSRAGVSPSIRKNLMGDTSNADVRAADAEVNDPAAAIRAKVEAAEGLFDDRVTFSSEEGGEMTLRDLLDQAEEDARLIRAVETCLTGGPG